MSFCITALVMFNMLTNKITKYVISLYDNDEYADYGNDEMTDEYISDIDQIDHMIDNDWHWPTSNEWSSDIP